MNRVAMMSLTASGLGLMIGYTFKKQLIHNAAEKTEITEKSSSYHATDHPSSALPFPNLTKDNLKSSDTVESLLALPNEDIYARLSLWMLDASVEDIRAYYEKYKDKKPQSNDVNDLIFINWTRLDPQSAVDAVKGKAGEHYVWWAWACHDPMKALAEVQKQSPGAAQQIGWAMGEFHSSWLMQHYDEIPKNIQFMALQGMEKWPDPINPEEKLDFLASKNRVDMNDQNLAAFIKKDPKAAMDWFIKQKTSSESRYFSSNNADENFIKKIIANDPDEAKNIFDSLPSSALKAKMETQLFYERAKADPVAAMAEAEDTKSPQLRIDKLAYLGTLLAYKDRGSALKIAEDIFRAKNENNITLMNAETGSKTREFINQLAKENPKQVMETYLATNPSETSFITAIADTWVRNDMSGLADWINTVKGEEVKEYATFVLCNKLREQGAYAEAFEWYGVNIKGKLNGRYDSYGQHLYKNWMSTNPAEAEQWLQTSNLPAEDKQFLQR